MVVDRAEPREGWRLAASGPEAYERFLVPALFAPWAERLLELVAPAPGERLLDVACGTGIVARRAARWVGPGGALAGVDTNPAMLAVARAAAPAMRPAVDWRATDAAGLPFPDGAFDVVCCQQGLQYFPYQMVALGEMRRVLAPQGRLALAVWRHIEHSAGFAALAAALERRVGAEAAAIMRAPFALGDGDGLRRLLAKAGFGQARLRLDVGLVRFPSTEEFLRRQVAASPLAGPLSALSPELRGALVGDLDRALAAYHDDDGVAFPIQAWLVTAGRADP